MKKEKWLGSLLNFLVPGLGNAYGRKVRKGVLTYILFFVIVLSLRFISYNFGLFLVSFIAIVIYYLYLIGSGYRDVKKDHVYEPMPFDRWYTFVLVLVLHWVLISSIKGQTIDQLTPINFASIPTPAMDPALVVGDRLAFVKTKAINRNDVTIFWFPDDVQTMYVKRCIGLPGDSLRIVNGAVLINGNPLAEIPLKFSHLVVTDGSEINARILEDNGISENDYFRMSPDTYQFFFTAQQAKEFRKLPFLKRVERLVVTEGEHDARIYPKSGSHDWNTDFYGSIYIPKKGDRIQLTDASIDFYLKCIEFENESVQRDDSGLKINGQSMEAYEFKESYYFMMGDNRHNSLDSRYWGFLPQELVIGRALYLYWGQTSDRIGKKVM